MTRSHRNAVKMADKQIQRILSWNDQLLKFCCSIGNRIRNRTFCKKCWRITKNITYQNGYKCWKKEEKGQSKSPEVQDRRCWETFKCCLNDYVLSPPNNRHRIEKQETFRHQSCWRGKGSYRWFWSKRLQLDWLRWNVVANFLHYIVAAISTTLIKCISLRGAIIRDTIIVYK